MSNYYPPIRRSRMEQHAKKRRKKDIILNILIGIVFLAIIIVGYSILFSNNSENEQASSSQNDETEVVNDGRANEGENSEENEGEENTNGVDEGTDNQVESPSSDEQTKEKMTDGEETGVIVEEQSDDPNVIKTVVNPSWQPIGTSQTGEHVTVYDEGSTDRIEMEQALAYATDTTVDNLIVWWLERGEIPNKHVIGTIEAKDDGQVYRVYLEWVDGKGWKPTKLEYLQENDKKS
ncbi:YrrS family protein [Fervidibacillus halotolerans]|uniref:DUF1510 family protein n=1 Tax=Fervidibacillus halotolerans TaxID=2980027 RepID=A0A9E8RZD6_9BACI|nr:DUF1510 family protein [Fervidibacillus halotolerans]WAA11537.1 DUF1510 family protein [Fervidibacillus halotolerans]